MTSLPEFFASPDVKIDAGVRPEEGGGGCLVSGTSIVTPDGAVCVEDLSIGSMVLTASGVKPIRWIGRRSYSDLAATADREVLPIHIRRDALGDNVPSGDLWVSPEHAMFIDGMLIPAALLINGVSIVQEESADELTYFHLEFDAHTIIYAEDAPTESFVDDQSRAMFDNAAEYRALYPDAIREPAIYCAPRVEDGEELENVRRQLMERAGRLILAMAVEAASGPQGLRVVERAPDPVLARSASPTRTQERDRAGHGG
jgi:hypothetical protein